MKIADQFTVDAPIERAWEVLTDLEGIAPLLPGARMTGREGDDYSRHRQDQGGAGHHRVRRPRLLRRKDSRSHTAVIDARGKEKRGSGNASAHHHTRACTRRATRRG